MGRGNFSYNKLSMCITKRNNNNINNSDRKERRRKKL